MTEQDRKFHAFGIEWYKRNRAIISPYVEAVTGLPVTSPDALYCPVKILTEPHDPWAGGRAWNPIPSQLNRRVVHDLDFRESANFLNVMLEQCAVRANTVAFAENGLILRDTIASREFRKCAARCVGKADIERVVNHARDILVQGADDVEESTFLSILNVARRWSARASIAYNAHSVLMQGASLSAFAEVMIGHETVGVKNVARYLATVATDEGREAIRELVADMGFKARYEMGWSDDVQNILRNPNMSRFKLMRGMVKAIDAGFKPAGYADRICSLWVAQGLYRDLTKRFVEKGETVEEAKRKAKALTIAAVEQTQQSGRISNMNPLQRKKGALGSFARLIFQFKSAQLLTNNFLIHDINAFMANKSKENAGRLVRDAFIVGVLIPSFSSAVETLFREILGEEPPEDEEAMPIWFQDYIGAMIDGVTGPIFFANQLLNSTVGELTGKRRFREGSGIPALDQMSRTLRNATKTAVDALDVDEELRWEKVRADLDRLMKGISAPYRHASKAIENRTEE